MSTQTPTRTQLPPPPPAPAPTPARRPSVGAATLGAVLVAVGTVWLLAALGVDVPVRAATPIVLIVLGLGVAVSAVRGEDHGAIGFAVFLGFLLAAGALLVGALEVPIGGGVGEEIHAPRTAADVDTEYRHLAGSLTVDLRAVSLEPGTTTVDVSTVLGEVEVLVPAGMAVRADLAAVGGSLDLLGTVTDGLGVDDVYESPGYADAARRLELEVRVGLGEARVVTD